MCASKREKTQEWVSWSMETWRKSFMIHQHNDCFQRWLDWTSRKPNHQQPTPRLPPPLHMPVVKCYCIVSFDVYCSFLFFNPPQGRNKHHWILESSVTTSINTVCHLWMGDVFFFFRFIICNTHTHTHTHTHTELKKILFILFKQLQSIPVLHITFRFFLHWFPNAASLCTGNSEDILAYITMLELLFWNRIWIQIQRTLL